MKSFSLKLSLLFFVLSLSQNVFAYSHAYVNDMRNSSVNHLFISQSVDGEYGTAELAKTSENNQPQTKEKTKWQGYGFTTTLGLETLNFIQFNVAHTFVNLRSRTSSLDRLSGSRFQAGGRLVFAAPVVNLEVGGGVLGSRYDYNQQLLSADTYGSGYYYLGNANYFLSSQTSLFLTVKMVKEHLVKNAGSADFEYIDLDLSGAGVGFSIWL